MSQSATTSAPPRDVAYNTVQAARRVNLAQAPVLITEQEVLFGTQVALAPRKASMSRRLIDAVRAAAGSLHLPPPHEHYPTDMGYLERSRMAREMDRL